MIVIGCMSHTCRMDFVFETEEDTSDEGNDGIMYQLVRLKQDGIESIIDVFEKESDADAALKYQAQDPVPGWTYIVRPLDPSSVRGHGSYTAPSARRPTVTAAGLGMSPVRTSSSIGKTSTPANGMARKGPPKDRKDQARHLGRAIHKMEASHHAFTHHSMS